MINIESSFKNRKKLFIWLIIICFVGDYMSITSYAQDVDSSDSKIIVSLGDSFSSGEGIEKFYDQDLPVWKKVQSEDWLAHRSQNSWSGMLTLPTVDGQMSEHRYEEGEETNNWYFVAASGATTKHMRDCQEKPYKKWLGSVSYSKEGEEAPELQPQFDVFDKFEKNEVDYVTLTLGGNDADFTGIVTMMVTTSSYLTPNEIPDKINETFNYFYQKDGIRDKLKAVYKEIEELAGKDTSIIVAGYPKLLEPHGSGLPASKDEARVINNAVTNFNLAISHLIKECQTEQMNIHFVSVEEAFENHGAYSAISFIHPVYILEMMDEDLYDIGKASAYSMHPNYYGACAYAICVQAKIDELEGINSSGYAENLVIDVQGYQNTVAKDYQMIITGRDYVDPWGIICKPYYKEIKVTTRESLEINLPIGEYKITVTNGEVDYSKQIKIVKNSKNHRLSFVTGFGSDIVVSDNQSLEDDEKEPEIINIDRNIVLTLDVSGSMSGTPLDETKKASNNFINTILEEDASIGLIAYDDQAEYISSFSNSKTWLQSAVNGLSSGGSTNIEDGLNKAANMLNSTTAKKKIIVLMSDGEPNVGKEGEELIAYANEIKEQGILIYTLGFFESLGQKSAAQQLMEGIASDGCHYEVASADDLVFFFEDMADQINGQKYIYVRIACPVDVSVTYNGQTLNSAEEDLNLRTEFGTLTFEESEEETSENEDDRIKVLRLKEGVDYDIEINGTGHGLMNYTIGFMDEEGNYDDFRTFENIKITRRTKIDTVAAVSSESILNIDEDGDGKYDLKLKAEANGYGEEVKVPEWIFIVIGLAASMIIIDIFILVILKKRKNKRRKADN